MNEREPGKPDTLLLEHAGLFTSKRFRGPVLDLACGDGHNGIFLAGLGLDVVLCDVSKDAVERAGGLAGEADAPVTLWQVDLEKEGENPLANRTFGGILVFRYLHRPLIPCLRKALQEGGILIYSTFTAAQARYGRPRNPDYLLQPGELLGWFEDWEVLHFWEGIRHDPECAMAELVCRRRGAGAS